MYSSKIELSETYFLDIMATQNDESSYVKHILGTIYVLFHRIWVVGGGGLSQGTGKQSASTVPHPAQLKNRIFQN